MLLMSDDHPVTDPRATPSTDAASTANAFARHLRVEAALIEATQMLVSSAAIDFEKMLGAIGAVVNARCVYLLSLPDDEALRQEALETVAFKPPLLGRTATPGERDQVGVTVWHCEGPAGKADWLSRFAGELERLLQSPLGGPRTTTADTPEGPTVLAVPILLSDDRLYGYLGFEYASAASGDLQDDLRVVGVLSNMLSAYFERQMAEHALRVSEERWRLLVEHHPDPIVISEAGELVYVNASGVALLGLPHAGAIGRHTLEDFISAEDADVLDDAAHAVAAGEPFGPVTRELIRLDGESRVVEWYASSVVHRGRSAMQFLLRDVTQRRRAERALQASEERYRTFIDTVSEAIWRVEFGDGVDMSASASEQMRQFKRLGVLAEANPALARLVHVPIAEPLIGRPIGEVAPCLSNRLLRSLVNARYAFRSQEVSVTWKGSDQRHFVVNAVGTIVDGRLVRLWGSAVEVTDRVELERQMVKELERQQQQIGRDLHDGVGQYLTGVRMLSANLLERYLPEGTEGHDVARKVARFSEQAAQRVREIYTGLAPVQLYEDGLSAALDELAANLNDLPDVRCEFMDEAAPAVANREIRLQLYRIVQEATNNALKHASAGTIQIHLQAVKHEGGLLVLEVRDDGKGFDLEGPTRKSLGLRSMYYRARSIGAEFSIVSEPGRGTRVHCRLPLGQARAKVAAQAADRLYI